VTFPDAEIVDPSSEYQVAMKSYTNGHRIHEWFKEIRKDILDKYGDVVIVGELPYTDVSEVLKYVSVKEKELSMVFDFDMVTFGGVWNLPKYTII
jgi:oligo-1,6-glucosidase